MRPSERDDLARVEDLSVLRTAGEVVRGEGKGCGSRPSGGGPWRLSFSISSK